MIRSASPWRARMMDDTLCTLSDHLNLPDAGMADCRVGEAGSNGRESNSFMHVTRSCTHCSSFRIPFGPHSMCVLLASFRFCFYHISAVDSIAAAWQLEPQLGNSSRFFCLLVACSNFFALHKNKLYASWIHCPTGPISQSHVCMDFSELVKTAPKFGNFPPLN